MLQDPSHLSHCPAAAHWQRIGVRPHHGIAIPLFSLHSASSHGIGEWFDLKSLVDWCASIGFDIIQLLPVNDTGLLTSPYSALSAFALNPLFLTLSHLPLLDDYPALQEKLKALPKFSNAQRLDYQKIRESKEMFFRDYYQTVGQELLAHPSYQYFVQKTSWLKGYAVFKILWNRNNQQEWESWPTGEKIALPALLKEIEEKEQEEFHWHCLLQFLCDQQLREVKSYAAQKNVFLMGDIPILVDRNSADVWQYPDLFHLSYSVGAPPDYFNEEGQNWGAPIYNWSALTEQNYQWWQDRLQWAQHYYHLYRIDHIIGLFRMWAIPAHQSSKEGFFLPSDETEWIDKGQRLLMMMLNASDMLPIGEDLGVAPDGMRECLSALGICGTRVMRWERKWKKKEQPFILPQDYPLESMTTVSTHDTETLQEWWTKNPSETKSFADLKGWSYHPILSRDYRKEILWDSHHTASLFHINPLQEYLPLIPELSGHDPAEGRINIPGLVSDQNWTYRLRLSLEDLFAQNHLQDLMRDLIK